MGYRTTELKNILIGLLAGGGVEVDRDINIQSGTKPLVNLAFVGNSTNRDIHSNIFQANFRVVITHKTLGEEDELMELFDRAYQTLSGKFVEYENFTDGSKPLHIERATKKDDRDSRYTICSIDFSVDIVIRESDL